MQIKKVMQQLKEYNRLQDLINNIGTAINKLTTPVEPSAITVDLESYTYVVMPSTRQTEIQAISLNSDVSKLIAPKLILLLKDHLFSLKTIQEELEV